MNNRDRYIGEWTVIITLCLIIFLVYWAIVNTKYHVKRVHKEKNLTEFSFDFGNKLKQK